jgi:CRISPR/Cas system-associated exonuclease Cas4 (RecB family)
MNKPFLESLAEHILSKYQGEGNRLCVVMPNRRAGLFLKQYLSPVGDKPIWAPAIFSVEDFVAHITGLTIPDPLVQMSALYKAHCEINGTKALPFDDFIGWSKGLIRDFEETDQYLIDRASLYGHLSETRALSLWNLNERPLTEFEQNYLQFFRSLPEYYRIYREILTGQNLAYHGLACRLVAENPAEYLLTPEWNHIIFAGFNAITPAQLKIFHYLIASGKSEIHWDADAYYINNPDQEAGRFLRKHLKDESLGKNHNVSDYFGTVARNIKIAGIPRQVGQTMLAGSLISELITTHGPEILTKTAVVLADESLLIPLLNAIPPEAGQFNVTMGYPLMQSPVFTLFDGIIEMHINASSGRSADFNSFYHRNLIQVLQHSHMHFLSAYQHIGEVLNFIRGMNLSYIGLSDLSSISISNPYMDVVRLVMQKTSTVAELIHLLQELISLMKAAINNENASNNQSQSAETEILFNLAVILNRLETISADADLIGSHRTLRNLFREAAMSMPVAFYGEPLKGIQVMGMLETRTLDFENIILLSANEDKLPSGKSYNSFIPFDIRREFGMPTHQDQQAVYAYHFYRLMQRSSNIWLIYNSEADDLGGGEKSRFISQILHELAAYSSLNTLTQISPATESQVNHRDGIKIEKDQIVLNKLLVLAEKGLSPTTVNQYLNCSMRFYFSSVLGLGETTEVEETIDFRTLGTVVHEVLERFYENYLRSFPAKEDYHNFMKIIPEAVSKAMQKNYPGGDTKNGRNLLIVKVAETWIKRFLQQESEQEYNPSAGDHIIAVERRLEDSIIINTSWNGNLKVNLKGSADRIDRVNGLTRIIDYKTGKVENRELRIKSADELFETSAIHKEKAFQLMCYLLLVNKEEKNGSHSGLTQAGIISFRSLKQGFRSLEITDQDSSTALAEFEAGLIRLFEEICDPEIPFTQTDRKEDCYFCPFKGICSKTEEKQDW